MKGIIFIIFLVLFSETTFSQDNYGSGNGMVVAHVPGPGIVWTKIRKHEQNIKLHDDVVLPVYESYGKNSQELFKLRGGGIIRAIQFAYVDDSNFLHTSDRFSAWIKVVDSNNRNGWVFVGFSDLYGNGNWAILETITSNKKRWTVRKLDSHIIVNPKANLRDRPGIYDSTILYTYPDYDSVSVDVIAITEEKDTINGKTDHWLRIMDNHRRVGWVFGDDTAEGERGGHYVKYSNLPEYEIELIIRFYGLSDY